ncbi:MAG: putative Ig domain-containing protein [Pirellulaceae bacterium]
MLVSDWQNPVVPTDVNDDGRTSPLDALQVINYLNRRLGGEPEDLGLRSVDTTGGYVDVNGDGNCSAIDALQVINQLNRASLAAVSSGPVPVGFQTVMLGQLPGLASQLVDIQLLVGSHDSQITEYGVFLADHSSGSVGGVSPSHADYAQAAWDARLALRGGEVLNTSSPFNFDNVQGGRWVGAYIVAGSDAGEFRINSTAPTDYEVAWESEASIWPGLSVGNRGFDDAIFTVTTSEPVTPNSQPVLAFIQDRTIDAGQTLRFQFDATDPDLPDDLLRFSLVGQVPDGVTVSSDGQFVWPVPAEQAASTFPVTIRVTDNAGAFAEQTFLITVNQPQTCSLDDDFGTVVVTESGGSGDERGSVAVNGCSITLAEGNSFLVSTTLPFVVPDETSTLSLSIDDATFDTLDSGFHRDAFEVAIVDQTGNPLVTPFLVQRDAAFNLTEGQPAIHDSRISYQNGRLSIGLAGLPSGQEARLVLRLTNNDADTQTAIQVGNVSIDVDLNAANVSTGSGFLAKATVKPAAQATVIASESTPTRYVRESSSTLTTGSAITTLRVSAPLVSYSPDETALISGSLTSSSTLIDDPLEYVSINGVPVQAIDAGHRFFSYVTIAPGDNVVDVVAHFESGQMLANRLLLGGVSSEARVDFDSLTDVTSILDGVYSTTSWNSESQTLFVDLQARNELSPIVIAPIVVAVSNINDTTVQVLAPDGITPTGLPYFDYSSLVSGNRLPQGQQSSTQAIGFSNPQGVPFTYDLVFFAKENRAPYFTSVPVVETEFNEVYRYDANAVDPDNDSLTFAVLSGPDGLVVDDASGILIWNPASRDIGTHDVIIEAVDGRGGRSEKVFTIEVTGDLPNRPPVITSTPETVARVGDPGYSYQVAAIDRDGDVLEFSLTGPFGMTISNSGLVEWIPTGNQTGNHTVTVTVDDGNGGTADQTFVVCVHADSENHSPVFVTSPIRAILGTSYRYDADAIDADGDSLSYSLVSGPSGMSVDQTGLVTWDVNLTDIGEQVTIEVSDGRGGFDRQSFFLLSLIGDGSIAGLFYEDVNGNGVRDTYPIQFVDDFESGASPLWQNQVGEWFAADGLYRAAVSTNNPVTYNTLPFMVSDFELIVDVVDLVDGGLWLRSPEYPKGVTLVLGGRDGTGSGLYWHDLTDADPNKESVPPLNEVTGLFVNGESDPRIRVTGEGNLFSAYVGDSDVPATTIELDSFTFGQVGLFSYLDTKFDRVELTATAMEPATADWTVFLDTNNNGFLDSGEPSQLTDQNGQYVFDGLAAGRYTVRELPQRGWTQTQPGVLSATVGDGYADVILEFFDGGNGPIPGPFGLPENYTGPGVPTPVSAEVILGKPLDGGEPASGWITLPTGSFVTAGFTDETIIDGPGDDIFIRSLNPQYSAGESADIFVSSNGSDFVLLGRAPQGGNVGLDLADIGFTDPVTAVRVVGVDNRGSFPGFELISLEVFPDSIGPGDGSYVVNLEAAQSVTGIDFGNQRIDETTVNRRPIIDEVPDGEVTVGKLYSRTVSATDPDGDPITFQLAIAPDGMTIHPKLGVMTWIPTSTQTGDFDVTVRVIDDRGNSTNESFTISSLAINAAPIWLSEPMTTVTSGDFVCYAYRLHAIDPEGGEIEYQLIDGIDGPGDSGFCTSTNDDIRNSEGNTVATQTTFAFLTSSVSPGIQSITLRALDESGAFTDQSFDIQVLPTVADQSLVRMEFRHRVVAGTSLQIELAPFQPLGTFYDWEVEDGPDGLTVGRLNDKLEWMPTADDIGEYRVRLVGIDGNNNQIVQPLVIDVVGELSNSPPVWTSQPSEYAQEGEAFQYPLAAFDPDNDAIRYELVAGPRGAQLDGLSKTLFWIPDDLQFGLNTFVVRATDTFGASVLQSFTVDVRCGNLVPSIVSAPPMLAVAGETYRYFVRGEDPEGDQLTYLLAESPDGMSIDPNTGVIRWATSTSDLGPHTVSIEVRDSLGGFGRQAFTLVVASESTKTNPSDPNSPTIGAVPPTITSVPIYSVLVDAPYSYPVTVSNPSGSELTYSLTRSPSGMRISAAGVIAWQSSTEATETVSITVRNAEGAIATQTYVLAVVDNTSPTFTSSPVTSATVGQAYRYLARATDPDGDRLTFSLVSGPDGLSISPTGNVTWTTDSDDLGSHPITISVTDEFGASVEQNYTLSVTADVEAPTVQVLVYVNGIAQEAGVQSNPGATFVAQVVATDNVSVQTRSLKVNGHTVPLDGLGRATIVVPEGTAELSLVGTAIDAAANLGTDQETIAIEPPGRNSPLPEDDPTVPTRDPNPDATDQNAPAIEITSPDANDEVTNITSIIGTVDDAEDNLWFYRVLSARLDQVDIGYVDVTDPDWMVLATSSVETINGELATFDPTMLSNDPYVVAVVAYDHTGNASVKTRVINVAGNVQVGNFRLEFTDVSLPLLGIPVQINRIYDTLDAGNEGDFGFGWSLGVQDARILETTSPLSDFIAGETKVYLTGPNGRRIGFTYQEEVIPLAIINGVPQLTGFFGDQNLRPYFVPDPGVTATLSVDTQVIARGGLSNVFNFAGTALTGNAGGPNYNFNVYTLTTTDGLAYRYDQVAGLQSITDRNGNVVTFTEDAITHSSGESIQLVRDGRGRIREVVLPTDEGEEPISVSYRYDVRGDLVSFTNQIGLETTYEYLSAPAHYLERVIDHRGQEVLEVQYDDEGRYVGVFDAAGNLVDSRGYDSDRNTAIIRDARGNETTLIYDDRGNVLTETDPLGNVTVRRYEDPVNPDLETTIIDRDGYITKQEFDERGNLLVIRQLGTESNPLVSPSVTTFTYDQQNNVTSITNALGNTTTFAYDAKGNLTRITNALGYASSFTYTEDGRQQSFTDFNGNTTRFEYEDGCPCGGPSRIVNADRTYQQFEYNLYGQVTEQGYYEADGTLVESSRTIYDELGRPVQEFSGVGADQIWTAKFYDGELLDWEIVINPESLDGTGRLLESPATPIDQRRASLPVQYVPAS